MNFQQLTAMIPVFEHVQSSSVSQALSCPANSCMMIVVRRGHVTIVAGGREPVIVTQGFSCHSRHSPIEVQVPRTKEAEYGADLMLLGDCLGRSIMIPREVPVGIMTAIIGAPYFVYLLRKERVRRSK
ncbi:iron chelate uptake ABC transporter family permease subunit [Paenibacillus sp. y28]